MVVCFRSYWRSAMADNEVTTTEVNIKTLVEEADPETIEDRMPVVYEFSNGRQFRKSVDSEYE